MPRLKLVPQLLVSVATLGLTFAAQAAQPKITLSTELWDFGDVWYGQKLNSSVTIKNEGDEALKINRVRASCGCTAGQAKKNILQPGESTEVAVSFDSKKRQGQVNTQVNIFSNDPDRPQSTIYLKGFVKRAVGINPIGGCVLRGMDPAAVVTGKATITNQVDEPMNIEIKSVDTKNFEVELKEIEPGKVYEVLATSKPPFQFGRTTGMITLATSLSREPEINLPIVATIVQRVELSPKAIYLDRDMTKKANNRTVRVMYYGENPNFKVESVEENDSGIKADVRPMVTPSAAYARMNPAPTLIGDIRLALPPGRDLPPNGHSLVVRTNEPGFERIELLVTSDAREYHRRLGTGK